MYQFISKQIKELVSKQGLDVVATTSKVLLNIQQLKLKSIQRLSLSISETLLEIPTMLDFFNRDILVESESQFSL